MRVEQAKVILIQEFQVRGATPCIYGYLFI